MGCKQTTTKSPSSAFAAAVSSTAPIPPIYVKSALKNSRANGKGKVEKRSLPKRNGTISKSVNFDERVRVKLRTPTPKQTRHEKTLSKIETKQPSATDNEDSSDDQLSSISSQEDIRTEQIKTSVIFSNPPVQRNQSNGLLHKNNSVATVPSTNSIRRKPPPPPPPPALNAMMPMPSPTLPTETQNILTGNRFRVRRKVPHPSSPQTTNPVDLNQTLSPPIYRSTVQPLPALVQRPPPSTIEHPTSLPNDNSSPQIPYYAFIRRPPSKKTSTEN